MPESIYLGWRTSHPIVVSDEGYAAIVTLIQQHRVCTNGCAFSAQNPMVAENLCLSCLLNKQAYLTFVGPIGEPNEEGDQQFKFVNDRGYVYLTSTRYSNEAQQDSYQTLLHWDFPVPTVYQPPRGEAVQLYPNTWSIYGNLQASVVVIEKYYDEKHTVTFLSYKNGQYRELTKRDAEMKRLMDQATDILEESKGEDGFYKYGESSSRQIRDWWIYEVVSQIAAAVYDVKLRLRLIQPQPQQADCRLNQ